MEILLLHGTTFVIVAITSVLSCFLASLLRKSANSALSSQIHEYLKEGTVVITTYQIAWLYLWSSHLS